MAAISSIRGPRMRSRIPITLIRAGCLQRCRMPKVLQISDLSVSFATDGHRRVALQDVSLSVEEGETLGVIGESGSGKSTILRAILGLAPVLAGDIRLGGQDVRAMTRMQLARC